MLNIIAFKQWALNFAGFVAFCAVMGFGVYLIFRLAKVFLRACKGANKTIKAFAGVGALILLLILGFAVFWVAVGSLILISGTSSLH
jgi:hypothetical protein